MQDNAAKKLSSTNTFFRATLAESDPEMASAIAKEFDRQQHEIELIASENIVSKAVLEAAGSVLDMGSDVSGFLPGDRVTYLGPVPGAYCGVPDGCGCGVCNAHLGALKHSA